MRDTDSITVVSHRAEGFQWIHTDALWTRFHLLTRDAQCWRAFALTSPPPFISQECAQRVTFGKNAISSFRFPLRARALPPIIRTRAVMNFSKRGQSERNNERQTLRWCRSWCIIHLPSPSPSVKSWWQRCFGRNSLSKPNRQNQHFYFYMTPPWLENHRPQDKRLLSSPPEAQLLIFKLTKGVLALLKEVFSINATCKV